MKSFPNQTLFKKEKMLEYTINALQFSVTFLYPLKTSENQRFSGGIEM